MPSPHMRRKKKKMTSILPDSLDVIAECSEGASESSSLLSSSWSEKTRQRTISSEIGPSSDGSPTGAAPHSPTPVSPTSSTPEIGENIEKSHHQSLMHQNQNNHAYGRGRNQRTVQLSPITRDETNSPISTKKPSISSRSSSTTNSNNNNNNKNTNNNTSKGSTTPRKKKQICQQPKLPSPPMAAGDLTAETPRSHKSEHSSGTAETYASTSTDSTAHQQQQTAKEGGESRLALPLLGHTQQPQLTSTSGNTRGSIYSGDACRTKWRLPPQQSHSDCTVRITWKDANSPGTTRQASNHNQQQQSSAQVKFYHLHRVDLTTGPRKSEYFASIFQSQGLQPKETPVIEFTLPAPASRAMPFLLDYVYSSSQDGDDTRPGEDPKIPSEIAVALRHLAQFLGIKLLYQRVMDFIQKDLSVATIVPYCRDSILLQDEKLMTIVARHWARNILKLSPYSAADMPPPTNDHSKTVDALLRVVSPLFLVKVLLAPSVDSIDRQQQRSRLVVAYLTKGRWTTDADTFATLTAENMLPNLHPQAALALLEMEADLFLKSTQDDSEDDDLEAKELTSLQKRCVRDLAGYWHELTEWDLTLTTRTMKKLSPTVITQLLVCSLTTAQKADVSKSPKRNPKASIIERVQLDRSLLLTTESDSSTVQTPERTLTQKASNRKIRVHKDSIGSKSPPPTDRSENSRSSSRGRKRSDSSNRNSTSRVDNKTNNNSAESSPSSEVPPQRGMGRKSSSAKEMGPSSRGLGPKTSSARHTSRRGLGRRTASTGRGLGARAASNRETVSNSKMRGLHAGKSSSMRQLPKQQRNKSQSPQRQRSNVEQLKAQHQAELARIREEYEAKLSKLRDMCVEKDEHIAKYREEIRRYQRLPNNAKLTTSGIFHGQATKMPQIGNQPRDGQLFVARKENAKFAVFYYK